MRKLNNPMPSGGAPFTNEDLSDVFQTEIWAALQAMLSVYDADAEGVIVSGCVVTPNAGNFDMTAGIVYLNGEFMRVDAVTNQTFTKYIKATPVTNVARVFQDTISKTFIVERKAEVSATVDGSGQEITISSVAASNNRRFSVATATKLGLTKLYANLDASNTDGAVTQAALRTSNFNTSGSGRFDGGIRTKTSGPFLKIDVIEIGDWNMDANEDKSVNHTIANWKSIRVLSVEIKHDDTDTVGDGIKDLRAVSNSVGDVDIKVQGSYEIGPSSIHLKRLNSSNGGVFDNTTYNSTSYNRGWITILYEA